jgi:hypothetical protein
MPVASRGARRTLRVGIAGCLAATAIGLGLAGPATAADPPTAVPAVAATPPLPPLPPTAAVPAGAGGGRKIG